MSLLSRLRRLWWRYVRRYDSEICGRCGRPNWHIGTVTYWQAPDGLWNRVEGGQDGIRCPSCFTKDAREHGIWVRWEAIEDA